MSFYREVTEVIGDLTVITVVLERFNSDFLGLYREVIKRQFRGNW